MSAMSRRSEGLRAGPHVRRAAPRRAASPRGIDRCTHRIGRSEGLRAEPPVRRAAPRRAASPRGIDRCTHRIRRSEGLRAEPPVRRAAPRRAASPRGIDRCTHRARGSHFTHVLSWMIGNRTARTISITTPPITTISNRLQDGGHLQGAALHLLAELCGGPLQHHRQLARLLAQAGEHRQQAGEAALAGQCGGEGRALANLHQRVERIGPHGAVRQRLRRRLKRLEDGHAGARQHGERAGEAGRVVAARELADQRHVEQAGIEALGEGFIAQHQPEQAAAGRDAQRQQPAPAAQERAQGQHGGGEGRAGRACCSRTPRPPAAPRR